MTTDIVIHRGEIATFSADVLVNATDGSLLGDDLLSAAGPGVLTEVQRIRETNLTDGLPAGRAIATNAGNLPAKWIVHTVAPLRDDDGDNSELLASATIESIELADKLGARSVVLPLIGLDSGWSLSEAATIAIDAVRSTDTHLELVTFAVSDEKKYSALDAALAGESVA